MLWPIIVLLLILSSPAGGAEPPFYETGLAASRRATSVGEAKKALRFYETQAANFEHIGRTGELAKIFLEAALRNYREASNTARFLGDLQKAIDHGEKAFALANELDDPRLKLVALRGLYHAYRAVSDNGKASEVIDLGLELLREFPPNALERMYWEAGFYASRSLERRARQEYAKAIADARYSLRLYEEYLKYVPNRGSRGEKLRDLAFTDLAFVYARLGDIYWAMARPDDALAEYRKGLDIAQRGNLEFSQVSLLQGLGAVYERREQYPEALDHFEKALGLARQQGRLDAVSDAARRMGDVYRKIGKKRDAIASYRTAIEQIESIRSVLSSQNNRQSYFGGGLAAYTGLITTLWETRAYGEAFHYGERVRSRTFLDTLGSKVQLSRTDSPLASEERALMELNDKGEGEEAYREFLTKVSKANPEQASLMSVQPLKVKDVQRLLKPGQVLLEYLVTPAKTYLWAVEQKRLRAYTIRIGRQDLVAKIELLRGTIANVSSVDDYQRIAQDLYELLLAPAVSAMKGKEIVFVPHDILHYLPFHALYSPSGRYLIEDFTVSYLPSASLLKFAKSKSSAKVQKVLAIGNPKLHLPGPDLPLAETEVQEVKKQFPGTNVLLQEEAGEGKFKRLAPRYDILHVAAHSELSAGDPLSSSILLAQDAGEDGRLEVQEIFGMNLNANLVVLSGCETGLGNLASGDELVGLTRAFIYAGTPSVVASLWKVDDASTARLMGSFYRNLKNKGKIEALRQAQLEMIRGEKQDGLFARRGVGGIGKLGETAGSPPDAASSNSVLTSHPYFWAPFILVGDGQ